MNRQLQVQVPGKQRHSSCAAAEQQQQARETRRTCGLRIMRPHTRERRRFGLHTREGQGSPLQAAAAKGLGLAQGS